MWLPTWQWFLYQQLTVSDQLMWRSLNEGLFWLPQYSGRLNLEEAAKLTMFSHSEWEKLAQMMPQSVISNCIRFSMTVSLMALIFLKKNLQQVFNVGWKPLCHIKHLRKKIHTFERERETYIHNKQTSLSDTEEEIKWRRQKRRMKEATIYRRDAALSL